VVETPRIHPNVDADEHVEELEENLIYKII